MASRADLGVRPPIFRIHRDSAAAHWRNPCVRIFPKRMPMDLPHAIHATTRWIPLLACIALAAAQAPTDPVSQIRGARERSNRALSTHDIKAFGESLAADFVIVRGNGVFMPSRQAWIDAIEADFKNPNAVRYQRIPDKIEISSVSPIAAGHGHRTATLPNGNRTYTGTDLAMWRRQRLDGKFDPSYSSCSVARTKQRARATANRPIAPTLPATA
jgi:hypothetical protein